MKFRDSKGREFQAAVNLQTVVDLKETAGFDLNEIITGNALERLTTDPQLLVSVLWVACEESIEAHGITEPKDFARGLGGDTLAAAMDALLEAIVLFFPPSQRTALAAILDKGREVERLAGEKLRQAVSQIDPEAVLTSSGTAIGSPESPAVATHAG